LNRPCRLRQGIKASVCAALREEAGAPARREEGRVALGSWRGR